MTEYQTKKYHVVHLTSSIESNLGAIISLPITRTSIFDAPFLYFFTSGRVDRYQYSLYIDLQSQRAQLMNHHAPRQIGTTELIIQKQISLQQAQDYPGEVAGSPLGPRTHEIVSNFGRVDRYQ